MDVFSYLIPAALTAVAIVLAIGIYALFRGGDFGRSYSNKLMRLRVLMQAIAIAVLRQPQPGAAGKGKVRAPEARRLISRRPQKLSAIQRPTRVT